MKLTERGTPAAVWAALFCTFALLLAPPAARGQAEDRGDRPDAEAAGKAAAAPPGAVEVRMTDDSTLKMILREERIEVATRFGKLSIPVRDVQKVQFGRRIPEARARKIASSIENLGATEFKLREAATADLLALPEEAYPRLLEAAKGKDPEVARRANELVEKIRDTVPEEKLRDRPNDVLFTSDGSRIVGRVAAPSFRVGTAQFGEQQLNLSDAYELRSQSYVEATPTEDALADPGTLGPYMGQTGRVFKFTVTGAGPGGMAVAGPGGPGGRGVRMAFPGAMMGGWGAIWGTDVYTLDSALAVAAVHAGVVRPGQTKVVKVQILGPQPAFTGSTRNGVTSENWGAHQGAFKFVK